MKQKVIDRYGGECRCCGEKGIAFLTIEHARRDGKRHRFLVGGGRGTYRDLINRGFPTNEGIEILCMNCNFASRMTGKCPHSTRGI